MHLLFGLIGERKSYAERGKPGRFHYPQPQRDWFRNRSGRSERIDTSS